MSQHKGLYLLRRLVIKIVRVRQHFFIVRGCEGLVVKWFESCDLPLRFRYGGYSQQHFGNFDIYIHASNAYSTQYFYRCHFENCDYAVRSKTTIKETCRCPGNLN